MLQVMDKPVRTQNWSLLQSRNMIQSHWVYLEALERSTVRVRVTVRVRICMVNCRVKKCCFLIVSLTHITELLFLLKLSKCSQHFPLTVFSFFWFGETAWESNWKEGRRAVNTDQSNRGVNNRWVNNSAFNLTWPWQICFWYWPTSVCVCVHVWQSGKTNKDTWILEDHRSNYRCLMYSCIHMHIMGQARSEIHTKPFVAVQYLSVAIR